MILWRLWPLSGPPIFFFFLSSKGDVSFENVLKALKQFFFAGLQGQQLFLVLALKLSVSGLLLKDCQPHISKVNKYLPETLTLAFRFLMVLATLL